MNWFNNLATDEKIAVVTLVLGTCTLINQLSLFKLTARVSNLEETMLGLGGQGKVDAHARV